MKARFGSWFCAHFPQTYQWWTAVAVLSRWKVLLAVVAVTSISLANWYQNDLLDARSRHALQCERQARNEKLKETLYQIVDLSGLFPAGATQPDGVVAYTTTRRVIIDALILPIAVSNCPITE